MKKKTIALLAAAAVIAAGGLLIFKNDGGSSAGAGSKTMPVMESAGAGQLNLSKISTDIAYRLVLPDGTRTGWNVSSDEEDTTAELKPLEGGSYTLEICPLNALTVVNEEEDYAPYRYDLATEVDAAKITASKAVSVAQLADEGDNIIDLAEGDILFAPSYNDYAVFVKENNAADSEFDVTSVTDGPAIQYVSTDNGETWKKLTGDPTIISSSEEPVENGLFYALDCGASTTSITLDNINTTGTIEAATFCTTVMNIKGDVALARIDTAQLGNVIVAGTDSSSTLNVTRSIVGCNIEIKDLAELTITGRRMAINNMIGDLKLTNIDKMNISVEDAEYPSGICSYYGNIIFTDSFGTIVLTNAPNDPVLEAGEGANIIINADGAVVSAGSDLDNLQTVSLQTEGEISGIFPADSISACLVIAAE